MERNRPEKEFDVRSGSRRHVACEYHVPATDWRELLRALDQSTPSLTDGK